MKRISIVLLLFVSFCLSLYAQTASDITKRVLEIKQENGDSIARNYLSVNESIFNEEGFHGDYLLIWGVLTSNMWHENPSESMTEEYIRFLDSAIDNQVKSDDYIPPSNILSELWTLMYDYSLILNTKGNKEEAVNILRIVHRWFESYEDFRYTVGYAQSLLSYYLLLVRDMHKYEEGEPLAKEYLDVSKKVYGENSAQYAVAIYNMHIFPSTSNSEKLEIVKKAMSIYETADIKDPQMLELMKSVYEALMISKTGKTNTKNINVSSDGIYTLLECESLIMAGRGAEALKSLQHYKDSYNKEQYLDTIKYTSIITYIIGTYMQMNELASAQKEIEEFETKIGIDNLPLSASSIFYSSAGQVAYGLKDYNKALKYCHAACNAKEKLSEFDLDYCKILSNIGVIYGRVYESGHKQFILDAKWYIDESISVFEQNNGSLTEFGNTGIMMLSNKAFVYSLLGDNEGAIETYEKIVSDFAKNVDVKEAWALATNNLATMYLKSGHSEKAIELLEPLSSINKEYEMLFKQNLALAYYESGDEKLRNVLIDYNRKCYDNCLDVFKFFSEAEREEFWANNARELLGINNLIGEKYPKMTDVAYDNLLFVKNLKLMSSDILKTMVDNSNNMELKSKYDRILWLRDAISYRSNEQDSIDYWNYQLRDEERSILSNIPDYKEKLMNSFHSWGEIQKELKDGEIAIDFSNTIVFNDWEFSNVDNYYVAFIITKESTLPQLIRLCKADDIEHIFSMTSIDAMQISSLYRDSLTIYDRIWGKLEKYIKGKKTIYFSPAGQLNLLNYNAIVMPNGKLFGDEYNLVRLSSTDKIINRNKNKDHEKFETAVVYGGIQYDLSVAEMNEAAKNFKHTNDTENLLAMRSEDERGHWNYLPGTKTESQNIFNLLKSNNVHSVLLQNGEANEESFKALSGKAPNIIHLSTHGFFLDSQEKVKSNPFMKTVGNYSEKEDNMIRTGVLMAGANNVWCGKEQVNGIEDGILTADEISRLDLKGTKLVVLSACETAKGKIDLIDGVLGLQRGFKKAGVNSILMSLWKVSDVVTSMLMTEFYTNIGKGMSIQDALKDASQKIRKQYPDPYYWASFVVLD